MTTSAMTVPADRLAELRRRTEAEIAARDAALLDDFPPDRYVAAFDGLPRLAGYRAVPPEAQAVCAAIEARAGLACLEAYHRLVMLALIGRSTARIGGSLTARVRTLVFEYLDRVADDMEAPRKRYYVHANDRFAKDFAVCRLKLLPCGTELIDVCTGVSRRTLVTGGARQLATGLPFFLLRVGGFKPLYELHFDRRSIREFNEDGYTRMYLTIADLLQASPDIKGLMSGSWWHDPRLAEISPELGFIDKHPESAGARFFRVGTSDDATADATRMSPRRSALYKEGRYQPRVYMMVWARKDILAWARDYRARNPEPASGDAVSDRPGVSGKRAARQPAPAS